MAELDSSHYCLSGILAMMKTSREHKDNFMNSLKTALFSGLAALVLIVPTAAEAAPSFRVGGAAYNSETGNAARSSAGYNSNTGARYASGRGYDASSQTSSSHSRAYNPATGNGGTATRTASNGSGVNTTYNTINNGSYECNVSSSVPAHCVETSY